MGYVEMNVANVKDGGVKSVGFQKTINLTGAGSSDSVLIPDDIQSVSVTAQGVGGATASVFTSTDLIETIKAAGTITWIEWSNGDVTTATGGVFHPVTAIKLVQTGAGTSQLAIRAQ